MRPSGALPQTANGTSPNAALGRSSRPSLPSPGFGASSAAGAAAKNGATAKSVTTPGTGALPPARPSKPPAEVFEAKPTIDDSDAPTAIGPPPMLDGPDETPIPAPPIVAPAAASSSRLIDGALLPAVDARKADAEEDLEIGEVSRVVNLADIRPRPSKPAAARTGVRTGSVSRLSAGDLGAALSPHGGGPRISGDGAAVTGELGATGGTAGESLIAPAAAVAVQRRGLIVLIAAAAVLLAGGIAAVLMIVDHGDDNPAGSLAHAGEVDTSRPEDVIRRAAQETIMAPVVAPGSAAKSNGRRWTGVSLHPMSTATTDTPEIPGDPAKTKLRIDEIEEMARKQNDGTNRCYMRAQKGALGYEIQDLKKIAVTVTVVQDGTVSDVELSDHGGDQFGKCLIGRVKGWKFRASPGGTFRFELAFAQP
jgi:hypothetical protein